MKGWQKTRYGDQQVGGFSSTFDGSTKKDRFSKESQRIEAAAKQGVGKSIDKSSPGTTQKYSPARSKNPPLDYVEKRRTPLSDFVGERRFLLSERSRESSPFDWVKERQADLSWKTNIRRKSPQNKGEGQIDRLTIGIASPDRIQSWSERKLSTGSMAGWVKDPETVEYKTHKPIFNGLFCERIFGPVVDNTCACGRFAPTKQNTPNKTKMRGGLHLVCPSCEVEPTSSSVRRIRLGFIPLFSAVTHVWYWRGRPSYIPDLLGLKERRWGDNLINCHMFLLESKQGRNGGRSPIKWEPRQNVRKTLGSYSLSPFDWVKERQALPFLPSTLPGGQSLPSKKLRRNGGGFSSMSSSVIGKRSRVPLTQSKGGGRRLYNRSYTLPWTPFFTCPPSGRENLFAYLLEPADGEDRPIDRYCKLHRPALTTSFTDLLMNHPGNRTGAAQEVLSHTGGDAIRYLLSQLNLSLLLCHVQNRFLLVEEELRQYQSRSRRTLTRREVLPHQGLDNEPSDEQKKKELLRDRTFLIRRIKVIESFRKSGRRPEWMVISNLPVLPPGLRPIIRTADGIIATSDLNILYRRILFANKGLQKVSILNVNTISLAKRSLQDAVDALIENGKGTGKVVIDHNTGQPLKSLSASLKGKKGRFRHHLLGKRVDYSGRSVIIVGPTLHVHQCGLPMEMAIELFHPFLIRFFQLRKIASNVGEAKKLIRGFARRKPLRFWKILEQVMKHHPVLLNRAPTLHRLGIQAFQPILVKGRAIHLHPLVCTAFNADFDGDQMGVHIPLSFQARAEAWRLLHAPYHILSPATGQPILVPTQDMVLGCYYLTSVDRGLSDQKVPYFANVGDALCAHTHHYLGPHTPLWVRFAGSFESPTNSEEPLELQLHSNGRQLSIHSELQRITAKNGKENRPVGRYIRTTTGRIAMHQITTPSHEDDTPFPS
uniref:DNA-directed RNA polymerase subunit n=1 Tax=Elliptochloris bilobata TaxID=381761 RepID=A0A097KR27_9CHLO|nr:beta' subunit of RNA polymerase [Elliptochloris bilobata]AIT95614.1 beta' subunit of RNA polymerase [Elliptochloris bilobata]